MFSSHRSDRIGAYSFVQSDATSTSAADRDRATAASYFEYRSQVLDVTRPASAAGRHIVSVQREREDFPST